MSIDQPEPTDVEDAKLPQFRIELIERPVVPRDAWINDTVPAWGYRVHVEYPPSATKPLGERWDSPVAPLIATEHDAARAEARDRSKLVMALILGAIVESLEPRGVGDHGEGLDRQ